MMKPDPKSKTYGEAAWDLIVLNFPSPRYTLQQQHELLFHLGVQMGRCGGCAGLFTAEAQYWFSLDRTPNGMDSNIVKPPINLWTNLKQDLQISDEQIPPLVEPLNMFQSAQVVDPKGQLWTITVNPNELKIKVERENRVG